MRLLCNSSLNDFSKALKVSLSNWTNYFFKK